MADNIGTNAALSILRQEKAKRKLIGTTADGIRVGFLCPELLPEETGVALNNVGTTLNPSG